MSFQQVIILGNVGKEPEVRHLDGNRVAASFTVATSEYFTNREGEKTERVEWHSVSAWGSLAQFVEKYVKRGSSVLVVGKIRTRSYESGGVKKYVTEIAADSITFAGSKNNKDNNQQDLPY